MRKRIKNILLGCSFIGIMFQSCTPFSELNTDPTRLDKANPGAFLDPILYNISASYRRIL